MFKYSMTKLLVCDMAGTTIQEKGIVYNSLFKTIKMIKPNLDKSEITKFHGCSKSEVIKYFINDRKLNSPNKIQEHLESEFNYFLKNEYTKNNSVKLIHPDLPDYFNMLRDNGIKVALNTGYNKNIQDLLIDKLNMTNFIDDCISSDEVTYGRPYPFMIHKLMNRNNISDINNVIKIGDSVMDIKEGKNAGCKTVGVLSGADSRGILVEEDPDFIVSNIIDIKFI